MNELTAYFTSHGVSDAATARREAIAALGGVVRKQATIMAYADTFAVLGVLLLLAAALLIFTRRGRRDRRRRALSFPEHGCQQCRI